MLIHRPRILQPGFTRKGVWNAELRQSTDPVASASMEEPQNPESLEAIAYRLELTHAALDRGNQAAFASSIGVPPQAWTNYIKARDRISVDTALRMCRRYSITLDWVYRGSTYGMPAELVQRIEKVVAERASKRRQASEKT